MSASATTVTTDISKKEALEFSQWIFYEVQTGKFTIENLVECLLSEQHNQQQDSFERFKKALTYLGVELTKSKELFFEANNKAKDRKAIHQEDLIALRIAVENAVEKMLEDKNLEGRPSNTGNISAVLEAIKTSRNEREASRFGQWISYGVQAGQFSIAGLVDCLLSEQHNREQDSFERFKQALTHLKIAFAKGKELFFEANHKPKDRKEINQEDFIALRIAAENAVEKVLKNEILEGRPSDNISAVLKAVEASRSEAKLSEKFRQVTNDYQAPANLGAGSSEEALTPYKNAIATSSATQQSVKEEDLRKEDVSVNHTASWK